MILLTVLVACATTPADGICISGETWTRGNAGSALMRPGHSCMGCHNSGEGPDFDVAGTVYTDLDEVDDCSGVADVEVELTDADGQVLALTTNAAGNFYSRDAPLAYPITARLLVDGTEVRAMTNPVNTGDCASCHTATGEQGAPGRVALP